MQWKIHFHDTYNIPNLYVSEDNTCILLRSLVLPRAPVPFPLLFNKPHKKSHYTLLFRGLGRDLERDTGAYHHTQERAWPGLASLAVPTVQARPWRNSGHSVRREKIANDLAWRRFSSLKFQQEVLRLSGFWLHRGSSSLNCFSLLTNPSFLTCQRSSASTTGPCPSPFTCSFCPAHS